jgi:hypothetical protein
MFTGSTAAEDRPDHEEDEAAHSEDAEIQLAATLSLMLNLDLVTMSSLGPQASSPIPTRASQTLRVDKFVHPGEDIQHLKERLILRVSIQPSSVIYRIPEVTAITVEVHSTGRTTAMCASLKIASKKWSYN